MSKLQLTAAGERLNSIIGFPVSRASAAAGIEFLRSLDPREPLRGDHYGYICAGEQLEYAQRWVERQEAAR